MYVTYIRNSIIVSLIETWSEMQSNESRASLLVGDPITAATIIEQLENELAYYKSLLLADMNPSNASVLNALRMAVDMRTELDQLKGAQSMSSLLKLCDSLEKENMELKRIMAKKSSP